jgi:hypothetical protein
MLSKRKDTMTRLLPSFLVLILFLLAVGLAAVVPINDRLVTGSLVIGSLVIGSLVAEELTQLERRRIERQTARSLEQDAVTRTQSREKILDESIRLRSR